MYPLHPYQKRLPPLLLPAVSKIPRESLSLTAPSFSLVESQYLPLHMIRLDRVLCYLTVFQSHSPPFANAPKGLLSLVIIEPPPLIYNWVTRRLHNLRPVYLNRVFSCLYLFFCLPYLLGLMSDNVKTRVKTDEEKEFASLRLSPEAHQEYHKNVHGPLRPVTTRSNHLQMALSQTTQKSEYLDTMKR